MVTTQGVYDEALDRFHATGPEFEGWLSNHGPMVVEALARRGSGELVHRWTDSYLDRLDDAPVAVQDRSAGLAPRLRQRGPAR